MHSFGLSAVDDAAMSLTNEGTNNKLRQTYAEVLLQIARNLDQAQQQELRFYYSRSGLIPMEDTGFLNTLNSLEHVGMISWEDVRSLKEGLLAIQRLDLAKELTVFETKRDLTVLLDFYTRKRLGLDLCHRSDSVEKTVGYLLKEIVRDGFDITSVKTFVESSKNIKKVLNDFEEEIGRRSEKSSPWSKLTMLVVIAGEVIFAASANAERRRNELMELCFTAADKLSARMIKLGNWEDFCNHVEERYNLVWHQQNSESDHSSLLVKKEIAEVVQKLKESTFFR
ncbi:hypothetical protein ACROYT_G002220 [Oculina patagonica]